MEYKAGGKEKMKELLIVVDMQNDFVTGVLGSAEARAILPKLKQKIDGARTAGKTIVFTRDTHGADYLSTQEGRNLPVPHCIRGTEGWQIVEGLCLKGDRVFDKPTFGSLSLAEFIRDGEFGRVEFVGVCTDICVISNAMLAKAFCPETEIAVDASCCAGVTPESHERAIKAMRSCQIKTE